MSESETKTIGGFWCEGRDPSEGGWSFDETGAEINGADLEEATSREAALAMGIPASVLDEFEKSGHEYDDMSYGLFAWFCDHDTLFRPADAPEGWDDEE